jgi:RNA polymerase sigma factor (sigma-70 family)
MSVGFIFARIATAADRRHNKTVRHDDPDFLSDFGRWRRYILQSMRSDLDLLRQFARENSQEAFAALVQRHLDLVYSAALRQVRSPQLAEEIAQSVFADLARNADKLMCGGDASSPKTLTPWLYAVTRRTAVDVVRKESRRRLREQIAVEMNKMNATESGAGVPPVWSEIELFLDEAMESLDETDRSAVLLRYFENKSLREVGEALGASEDAAQKRVSRAVERLREFFSKRNVTIGAGGLTVLISANAVQSAPIGLAAAISAAAFAGTAVSTSTAIATTKVIAMTALQKTIIGMALVAAVGTGAYEAHQASQLREQNQTLKQQQISTAEQIRKLQRNYDDATNQKDGLLAENAQLQSSSNETELLKLRGEVTQLRAAEIQSKNDPIEIAAEDLAAKVNLLKHRLEQTPNEQIPELQFATARDWCNAALDSPHLNKQSDYQWDLDQLRATVEDRFGEMAMYALQSYIKTNKGQFPTDPSQLQPYFKTPVDGAILQRYEVIPANTVPKAKEMSDSWLIVERDRVDANDKNEGREVIGPKGYGNSWTFW